MAAYVDESLLTNSPTRILIFDDDSQLHVLTATMEEEGFVVIGSSRLSDVRKHFHAKDFDVAILSPNSLGIEELTLLVKPHNLLYDPPVIIHTSSNLPESVNALINKWVFACVEKTDDSRELLRQVHRAVEARLRRQIEELRMTMAQSISILKSDSVELEANRLLLDKQLSELEELYRSAPIGLCVVDRELRYLRINEQLAAMNGKPPEEHLGKIVSEMIPYLSDKVESVFQAAIDTGKPQPTIEISGYSCDVPDVLRHFLVNIYPIRTSDGISCACAIVLDITERKQMEEVQRESEARWRSYVENAPYGVFLTDEKGRYLQVNSEYCRVSGYDESELLSMSIADLLSSESQSAGSESFVELTKAGKIHVELGYVTKQGDKRWWTVAAVKLSETRFLGFANDITKRKRAEQELHENEERFRYVIKHNPDAIAVYDNNLNYIFVSDRYLRDYRLGDQDIIGRHHYDVFPEMPQRWKDVHQRCLQGAIESSDEDCFVRTDGSVDYNRWECRPWHHSDGTIGGIITYTEVITERKKAEKALEQHNQMLSFTNSLAVELASLQPDMTIQDLLLRRLKKLTGAAMVTFADYDQNDHALVCTHLEANPGLIDKIIELLGKRLGEARFPLTEEAYHNILINPVGKRLTLTEITFGQIPELVSSAIQKLLGIDHFIGISYVIEGKLYGTSLIGMKADTPDPSSELLEAFGHLAAVSLRRNRAEEALQESEERYRTLFSTMNEAFALCEIICDDAGKPCDWRYLELNNLWEDNTGLKVDDVIGKTAREIMPSVESYWIEEYGKVALTGQPTRLQRYSQDLNRYFSVSAYSPAPGIFAALFVDVTERERSLQEREITYEFLRLVNESTGTHGLIKAVTAFFQERSGCEAVGVRLKEGDDYPYYEYQGFDKNFILLENNLCARDNSGEIIRDSAGYPIVECMCGNIICGRFDPAKPFFTDQGSFWTNCTTELLANTSEADRQGRTRNRCNEVGYESVALIPLHFGEHRLGLLQLNDKRKGMFSRETISLWERLASNLSVALAKFQAEEALRASEDRFRQMFINMSSGVAIYDAVDDGADFVFKEFNPAAERITKIPLADVVGRPISHLFPDSVNYGMLNVFERVWRTGAPEHYPAHLYQDDRVTFWAENYVYKLPSGEIVAVFDDVTERIRLEEERIQLEAQLRHQQKLESIGTLASGVAHEINNPIMGIMNYAELITFNSGPPVNEYAETIIHESERVATIVRNLLAFARHEQQEYNSASMAEILEETLSLIRAVLRHDQVQLTIDMQDDLPLINCRSQQIQQVLMNLLSNARDSLNAKYPGYHEDKIITIHTSLITKGKRQWIRTVIEDHGIGIPANIKGRIFDPFFTTKPVGVGTGLGLSISHGIVKEHGGVLDLKSEPGKYARFILELPIEGNSRSLIR